MDAANGSSLGSRLLEEKESMDVLEKFRRGRAGVFGSS